MGESEIKGQKKEGTQGKTWEPSRKAIVLFDNDCTPVEFVVDVLITLCGKNGKESAQIIDEAQKNGSALVGTYSKDIAESIVSLSMTIAKKRKYPFLLQLENT